MSFQSQIRLAYLRIKHQDIYALFDAVNATGDEMIHFHICDEFSCVSMLMYQLSQVSQERIDIVTSRPHDAARKMPICCRVECYNDFGCYGHVLGRLSKTLVQRVMANKGRFAPSFFECLQATVVE